MNFENLLDNLVPKVSRRENLGTSWLLDLQGFKNYNCNPFLSSSIVHPWLVCISGVTYTFFECFEPLFLCSTKFGGSSYYLNFDKFCDTAPLSLPVRSSAETDGTLFY